MQHDSAAPGRKGAGVRRKVYCGSCSSSGSDCSSSSSTSSVVGSISFFPVLMRKR